MDMTDDAPAASQAAADLGIAVICLNVAGIHRSVEFYGKLGFTQVSGNPDDGWAVLRLAGYEINLFEGHIEDDVLNFRGGDVFAIHRGLKVAGFEFSTDAETEDDGSVGATLTVPGGFVLYFNSTGEEMREYASGAMTPEEPVDQPYGIFLWSIPVEDARAGVEYLKRLGFTVCYEHDEEDGIWIDMEIPGNPQLKVGFSQGISPGRMLVFSGGEVYELEKQFSERGLTMDIPAQKGFDGVDSMMVRDPDGNMVCFHGPEPAAD